MQTRAAVFRAPGEPLAIETLTLAEPGPGEIRVRMRAVGLCRSDHNVIAGLRPVAMAPMVLGHEGAGIVEAVGPGVSDLSPGEAVVLTFITACGECRHCVAGHGHACVLSRRIAAGTLPRGGTRLSTADGTPVGQFCMIGAFSERVVVDRRTAIALRHEIPLVSACLAGCGVAGGFYAATLRAGVTPGSSALVIGTGGLGMNVVQGLRHAGARSIVAVDRSAERRAMAPAFGATHVLDADDPDWVAKAIALNGGEGLDHAFVSVAAEGLIEQAAAATGVGASIVVTALFPQTIESLRIGPLALVLQQKTLMGTLYGGCHQPRDIPRLFDLYHEGRLKLDELVTRTYSLDQVNEGYADLVAGRNLRGVVQFD